MCFSASASFAGGVVILAIGAIAVKTVHKKSHLLFALIPVFFALQQLAEGLVWISLPNPDYVWMQLLGKYLFLTVADVIWPIMMPLSVLLMEENPKKLVILKVLLLIGILVSLYYAYCLIFCQINPETIKYHIHYKNDFPETVSIPAFIVYLIATITPFFISSVKRIRYFGLLLILSCVVTAIFFFEILTSVFCFFAAMISVVIFWILRDSKINVQQDKGKQ